MTGSSTSRETARDRILRAAIRLFQQRSYHGVGLSEILEEARAPKGSLYHHFPNGKAQLAVAAVESIAADAEAAFEHWRARGASTADILRKLGRVQARWLTQTDYRQAGLFSVLAQGFVPEAPELQEAIARICARRQQRLEHALHEDGAHDCFALSTLALAALDGGMIQAAAARDARLLRLAVDRAALCLDVTPRR